MKQIDSFTIFSSPRISLHSFLLLISYFKKLSTWIWRLPFAVNMILNLSIRTWRKIFLCLLCNPPTVKITPPRLPRFKLWIIFLRTTCIDCRHDVFVGNAWSVSRTFDTLDHTILVFNYFGFSHTVLTSRTHSVIIANTTSSNRRLGFGVSQGSLPGPFLFTLYTAPFQAIVSAHNRLT